MRRSQDRETGTQKCSLPMLDHFAQKPERLSARGRCLTTPTYSHHEILSFYNVPDNLYTCQDPRQVIANSPFALIGRYGEFSLAVGPIAQRCDTPLHSG